MEVVNGRIVVSVIVLMVAGVYRLTVMKTGGGNLTRVIVGAYMLAIVASIIDLVGGPISVLAGLLLMLAVGTALYSVIPDLISRIQRRPQTTP